MIKITHPDNELDRLTKRYEFQRQCRAQNRKARDPILNLLSLAFAGITGLVGFVGILIAAEWQPGAQADIYRAQRHTAAPVVIAEHKPSIEIVP